MSKRGLPNTLRMRHDEHYVEALTASEGAPVGRMVPIESLDALETAVNTASASGVTLCSFVEIGSASSRVKTPMSPAKTMMAKRDGLWPAKSFRPSRSRADQVVPDHALAGGRVGEPLVRIRRPFPKPAGFRPQQHVMVLGTGNG